jgi:hypothetical protein
MGAITGARGEKMRGIEQRVSAVVPAAALSMGFRGWEAEWWSWIPGPWDEPGRSK